LKAKIAFITPVAALSVVGCANESIETAASDLSKTLETGASAAPSINVETGNAEVDGLVSQLNDLISQAWNWGITTLQGLIEQVPILNQLV
jgi:hypothetical protein